MTMTQEAQEKQIPGSEAASSRQEETVEEKKGIDSQEEADKEEHEYDIVLDKNGKQMYKNLSEEQVEKAWDEYKNMTDEQREKQGPPRNIYGHIYGI